MQRCRMQQHVLVVGPKSKEYTELIKSVPRSEHHNGKPTSYCTPVEYLLQFHLHSGSIHLKTNILASQVHEGVLDLVVFVRPYHQIFLQQNPTLHRVNLFF